MRESLIRTHNKKHLNMNFKFVTLVSILNIFLNIFVKMRDLSEINFIKEMMMMKKSLSYINWS